MKRHKYADILEAIARGDDIEMFPEGYPGWVGVSPVGALGRIVENIAPGRLRIKPKTIRIGEYDVPEPMRVAPEVGCTYWLSGITRGKVVRCHWDGMDSEIEWLKNGLIQATKEGAELQLKALLSLTQKAEK